MFGVRRDDIYLLINKNENNKSYLQIRVLLSQSDDFFVHVSILLISFSQLVVLECGEGVYDVRAEWWVNVVWHEASSARPLWRPGREVAKNLRFTLWGRFTMMLEYLLRDWNCFFKWWHITNSQLLFVFRIFISSL